MAAAPCLTPHDDVTYQCDNDSTSGGINLYAQQRSLLDKNGRFPHCFPDIGGSDAPPRNWRGIGLAVLVITIVMSLVLLSIFLLSPEDPKQPVKPFLTLSDLETMEYQVHVPTLSWASDTEIILKTRDGNLIQQNVKTKEFRILLRNTTLVSLRASNAELSPDLQNILLIFNKQQAKVKFHILNFIQLFVATQILLKFSLAKNNPIPFLDPTHMHTIHHQPLMSFSEG
eukprot:XP_017947332.1 PREDICTED: inactive dipeptidyl peptidase 10-like [Xenopus tropicalis]